MSSETNAASQTAAAYQESQPLGEFALTILRYLPVAAAVGLLLSSLAFVLSSPSQPEPKAAVQIGLTKRVVWPFFDASRQRAVSTVENPSFKTELESAIGGGPLEVTVEAPDNQAFIIIEVTSDDAGTVAGAANNAADLLINLDQVRLAEAISIELDQAQQLLDRSKRREQELSSQLDSVVPVEAEAGANVGASPASRNAREALLQAQIERNGISQKLNEERRVQVGMQVEIEEAQTALAAIAPELEVLRPASPPPPTPARSWAPVFGAAIVGIVGALAGAIAYDRTRGRIESPWYAEYVGGVPLLADMSSPTPQGREVGMFLSVLTDQGRGQTKRIAVVGLDDFWTEEWLALIVSHFQWAGGRVVVVAPWPNQITLQKGTAIDWNRLVRTGDIAQAIRNGVTLVHIRAETPLLRTASMRPVVREIERHADLVLIAGTTMGDPGTDLAIALAEGTVIVASKHNNRVDQLRNVARDLRLRNERVLGMVLAARQPPMRQTPATDSEVELKKLPEAQIEEQAVW